MPQNPIPMRHVIRRLRFRHLELLAILETTATVRAAADAMQLTQPAVTRMLQEIESIFDARLFDRSARGVSPTALGTRLIAQAIALLNELDGTCHEIAISQSQQHDLLRIGAFSGARTIAQAFALLKTQHAHVRMELHEAVISELFNALLRGELDCLVGSLPPEELKLHRMDTLNMHPVAAENVAVVAARGSHWARRRRLGWADLRAAQWVLPPRDSLMRRAFIRAYLDMGIAAPDPVVEAMSPLTIRAMLEFGGVELGLVRSGHADEDTRLGVLCALSVTPQLFLPPVAVFTRRQAGTRQRIVEAMTEALRRVSGGG